ncbi:MAG: MFS transporter [Clostridia bacterium]|nr:MFS transporter [Clostridia bacterium]
MFKKNKTEYEKRAWRLVILCWLAYATVYIGKKTLSVNLSEMIADGVCDNVTGGTIGTAFLACYALGQFISGWVGEKVQPKNMVCGGLFLAGAMNILMSFGHSPLWFILFWGACGLACSMLWSPILRAVSTWTTEEIGQAAGASLSVTIPVGTILCYGVCALTLRFGSWRTSFVACGAILCLSAVIFYIGFSTLREHTSVSPLPAANAPADRAHPSAAAVHVSLFCSGLVLAAVCILFNGMIKDGLDLWIPTILNSKFFANPSVSSVICTILPLFNIVGVYWAKHMFSKYHWTELGTCSLMFIISAAALSLALVLIHFVSGGVLAGIAATILLALSSAAMLAANSMLLTFIPLHFGKIGRASAVTGMLNCFSYAAAAVSGVAVGFVSKHTSWEVVFLVFVCAAVLGFVFAHLGKPRLAVKIREVDAIPTQQEHQ